MRFCLMGSQALLYRRGEVNLSNRCKNLLKSLLELSNLLFNSHRIQRLRSCTLSEC